MIELNKTITVAGQCMPLKCDGIVKDIAGIMEQLKQTSIKLNVICHIPAVPA